MTYLEIRYALEQMHKTGDGWARLPSGKVATREDCERSTRHNNNMSPENEIEQARRDA